MSSTTTNILILGGTGRVGKQVITDALLQGHKVTALIRKPNSIPARPNLTLVVGSPTSTKDILKALQHTASVSASEHADSTTPTNPPPSSSITIISTLGQTRSNPSNPWSTPTSPALFITKSTLSLIDAIKSIITTDEKFSIHKLIILSAFGTGDSWPHLHWTLRGVMSHSNMRQMLEDHNEVIKVVEANFWGRTSQHHHHHHHQQHQRGTKTTMIEDNDDEKLSIPYVIVRPVMLKFNQPGPIPTVKQYGHGKAGMGMTLGCDVRSVSAFVLEKIFETDVDGTMPVISN